MCITKKNCYSYSTCILSLLLFQGNEKNQNSYICFFQVNLNPATFIMHTAVAQSIWGIYQEQGSKHGLWLLILNVGLVIYQLSQFPRVVVTNDHQWHGLKQHKLFSHSYGEQKFEIKVLARLIATRVSQEECISCLSPSFWPAIFVIPWLLKVSFQSLPPSSHGLLYVSQISLSFLL